jgi:hypothetical protein
MRLDASDVENVMFAALTEVFGGGEGGVVNELLFLIGQGELAALYGWPDIVSFQTEFPVPRGRIDLILFHVDGSATIIECKSGSAARDILPAVGQVMAYGVQVGYSRVLRKIRLAVASRASGRDLASVAPVLRACGIEPMFCGQHRKWARAFAEEQEPPR